MKNEQEPGFGKQRSAPRRTSFVGAASGKTKLKVAVFSCAARGFSFSSPWINFTSLTWAFREAPGTLASFRHKPVGDRREGIEANCFLILTTFFRYLAQVIPNLTMLLRGP